MRWTGSADGDVGSAAEGDVAARRRAVYPGPWAWLRQVHGATVHVVDRPGGVQGAPGDALVSATPGVTLAVFTADCAPVALASDEGVIAMAHAGWRGLELGVIEATVTAMRELGATDIRAALGPCIRPCCYAFGADDLDRLAARFGDHVRGETRSGQPAFDIPAAVAAALAPCGVETVAGADVCTGCTPGWFSHRVFGDRARQASLITVEPQGAP
ncbi:MAG: polyphenol oxidase family protein [Acidimicrobiales bacterium]